MSDVGPVSQSHAAAAAQNGRFNRAAGQAAAPTREADRVELSEHARYLNQASQLPEVRQELIDRVKAEIEAGTYDSADKIDALIDALDEEL